MRPLLLLSACTILIAAQEEPQAIYEQGGRYWNLSLGAFKQLQKLAPDSPYSFALLGEGRFQKRQYTAALDALTEAAKRSPRLRGVEAVIAEIETAQKKSEEAAKAEKEEQSLGAPDCGKEKLWCDFKAKRFEEVVKTAEGAPPLESLYWLARAYHELAVQTFAKLDGLPESAGLHKVRAQLLREERKFPESLAEWRTAVKLDPADPNLRLELAAALFLSEDYKRILPELQGLLQAEPTSAHLNFFVGDSFLETQQAEEAVSYLETALRVDPKLTPAHVALGMCYAHLGADEKAIPHLKAGLSLDGNGRVHYLLAKAYQKTGQPGLAKAMLDEYRRIQQTTTKPKL